MQWILKELSDEQKRLQQQLVKELNISDTLARLLVGRDIKNFEEAKKFFRPSKEHLHHPFLMHDMDKAVNRLHQAIQNKEKILIYGDYDVDGTTAVSSMYLFLQQLTDKALLDYYIPDRFQEGYGVSYQGIEFAKKNGFTLMIILDCGIKEIEKIQHAQTIGIDCIVCDHHLPSAQLPPAYALLNPKKPICAYPYKELTGCGIGFKLMQAYCEKFQLPEPTYWNLIDLVATSIAADIVSIDDENRVLMHFGLQKMNQQPSIGLKKLFHIAFSNPHRELKVSDLVFIIAPRINAAGRLEHGSKAVQLLIAENEQEAETWAQQLHDVNTQRQGMDKQTLEEALHIIENDPHFHSKKSTVVFKQTWNKGVLGIVAAKLAEKFYRPTIVLTEHNGYITGSARSIEDFDLYESLYACKDVLYQFGGHKHAAGLSIEKHQLNAFIEKFEQQVQQSITPQQQIRKLYADAELRLHEINHKFIRILKQFEPHGPSNPHPVFWIKQVQTTRMYEFGKGHLQCYLSQNAHKEYPAIFYNGLPFFDTMNHQPFDCLCKINVNNVQNEEPVYTLLIQDIKIHHI